MDESIEATRQGEYFEAVKEMVAPVRETLENGICVVVVAAMPSVEQSIASVESSPVSMAWISRILTLEGSRSYEQANRRKRHK